MIKIVIFTSNEYRHLAFIDHLSKSKKIKILEAYIEKKNEHKIIYKNRLQKKYFDERKKYEKKYFFKKNQNTRKQYEIGFISTDKCLNQIKKMNPDLIVVYGSSLIKGKIVKEFKKKIINAHLGLSPYYRGSGTNIFPFINKEIQYVGVTFMYLDLGIDTGKIIHQIRPDIKLTDNVHDIGNKLILKMFKYYKKIILNYKKIKLKKNISTTNKKYYKRKDFDEKSIETLNKNLKEGLIKNYLTKKKYSSNNVRLIHQNWL
jgi:phosphoribosylglycinamide formyltransferase-1